MKLKQGCRSEKSKGCPTNFPFELTAFVGELRRSERFETSRQGLDLEMVAIAG